MQVLLRLMMSATVQHATKIQMCLCEVILYDEWNQKQVFKSMEDEDVVLYDLHVEDQVDSDLQRKPSFLDGIPKQWGSQFLLQMLLKVSSLFVSRVSLCVLGAYFWRPIFHEASSGDDDSIFILIEAHGLGDEDSSSSMGQCHTWWIVFFAKFLWFIRLIVWATSFWPYDPRGCV